ncbi:MAG: transcription antitermination factor NusB [Ruminococcaceae bacterium]|nr:transcription antitermination factor NusB [Oscillospiraceae bacterium]
MSRKTARELALHLVFEMDFTGGDSATLLDRRLGAEGFQALSQEDKLYQTMPDERDQAYIRRILTGIDQHLVELDTYIETYSVGWKFGRISRIVACIMRLAMFEILYMPDVPSSVAINEAVELAKRYDTPDAASFVNGILGTFVRKEVTE